VAEAAEVELEERRQHNSEKEPFPHKNGRHRKADGDDQPVDLTEVQELGTSQQGSRGGKGKEAEAADVEPEERHQQSSEKEPFPHMNGRHPRANGDDRFVQKPHRADLLIATIAMTRPHIAGERNTGLEPKWPRYAHDYCVFRTLGVLRPPQTTAEMDILNGYQSIVFHVG
jgi:hypothetical protein